MTSPNLRPRRAAWQRTVAAIEADGAPDPADVAAAMSAAEVRREDDLPIAWGEAMRDIVDAYAQAMDAASEDGTDDERHRALRRAVDAAHGPAASAMLDQVAVQAAGVLVFEFSVMPAEPFPCDADDYATSPITRWVASGHGDERDGLVMAATLTVALRRLSVGQGDIAQRTAPARSES